MSSIQAAVDEFAKITRILKAFEGVGTVLAALENAEQVGRELDAAIVAKRAELEKLADDCVGAALKYETAVDKAEKVVADAAVRASGIIETAKAEAGEIRKISEAERSAADDILSGLKLELAGAREELSAVNASRDQAANELKEIRAAIRAAVNAAGV